MPVYAYKCDCKRSHKFDTVRSIADRAAPIICPTCGCSAAFDSVGSMQGSHSTDQEYHTPVYSSSLGVPPNQIKEAQKKFPHHEFTPDGRMVLRSHAQRNRVMKELGFRDFDGY